METKIRKMTVSDAKAVAELEKICFSSPWSEDAVLSSLADTNSLFFVAESDGIFSGYSEMIRAYDAGMVCNIAVCPEQRGKGIGYALVQALINAGRDYQLSFISLEVRVSNEKAIALYKKCGFENVGLRKKFYSHPVEDGYVFNYYY